MESKKGKVLSSFILASMSAINPFFLNAANIMTGSMNPNTSDVEIRINLLNADCSSVKAKIVKIIIVKEGGTKSIEIILAAFFVIRFFNLIRIFPV